MKKAKYFVIAFMMSAMVSGCSKGAKSVSLYDRGLNMVTLMDEMVNNDSYGDLFGATTLDDKVAELKQGDYDHPSAVYKISISKDLNVDMLSEEADGAKLKDMSEPLKEVMNRKVFQSITSQLSGYYGAECIATSAIYMVNQTFVDTKLDENTIYIYTYGNGYPVIVDFTVGEDHSVTAYSHFLMTTDFEDSEDGIKALFGNLYFIDECKVEKVDK